MQNYVTNQVASATCKFKKAHAILYWAFTILVIEWSWSGDWSDHLKTSFGFQIIAWNLEHLKTGQLFCCSTVLCYDLPCRALSRAGLIFCTLCVRKQYSVSIVSIHLSSCTHANKLSLYMLWPFEGSQLDPLVLVLKSFAINLLYYYWILWAETLGFFQP